MKLIFSKTLNYLYLSVNWVKKALLVLFTDKLSLILLAIILLINLLTWVGSYFLNTLIGDNLAVLHYNVAFGVDLVGSAKKLYLTPLLGLTVLIINSLLGALLKDYKDRLIVVMLLASAMLVNIFCLVALYFSYIINFS